MRLEQYQLSMSDANKTYDFNSESAKGIVQKRIQFQPTSYKNVYNLAFGDLNEGKDDFDDTIISDNDDTLKVLATVANSVDVFLTEYPNSIVYGEGGTPARNRLYQMNISKIIDEIQEDFDIFGHTVDKKWEPFRKNTTYFAFYIKRKNNSNDGKT